MTALQLLEAGWVVTMDPQVQVIRDGAVLIEDDRILGVGPAHDFAGRGVAPRRFPRHVLLPGIVDGHTHVAGSVFRGLLEDRANAFYEFALPMEPAMGAEAIYELSRLGIAELALAGCTAINDMFHHAAETARAVEELGIRAQIANKVFDVDLPGIGQGRRDYDLDAGLRRLADNVSLYDRWNGGAGGRIGIRFGLHAADTCSPPLMARILDEARRRGAGIHSHVAQNPVEDAFVRARYDCSSVQHLRRNDVLGPDMIAVHLRWADEQDADALAATGTKAAHCPACATRGTGRLGPFREMYERGVGVGWGTDWVVMDPWDAMRMGLVVYRANHADDGIGADNPELLTARDALWRFTVGSARMLGLDDLVGSLEPGKQADVILVDADQPHLAPMYDPISTLVYNASGRDVTHVMVGGQFVVIDRALVHADSSELVVRGQNAAERVWRAAASPQDMPLRPLAFTGNGPRGSMPVTAIARRGDG